MRTYGYMLLALLPAAAAAAAPAAEFRSAWPEGAERTWVGPEFWANRLQDWRLAGGRLECLEAARPMRTVHLLARRLGPAEAEFQMSVRLGLAGDAAPAQEAPAAPQAGAAQETPRPDKPAVPQPPAVPQAPAAPQGGAAGFLIGAGPDVDWRAAALVHSAPGPGGGIFCGIDAQGRPFFRDNTAPRGPAAAPGAAPAPKTKAGKPRKAAQAKQEAAGPGKPAVRPASQEAPRPAAAQESPRPDKPAVPQTPAVARAAAEAPPAAPADARMPAHAELRLAARPAGGKYALALTSHDPADGRELGRAELGDVAPARLIGSIALVSDPGGAPAARPAGGSDAAAGPAGARFWFKDWRVSGPKIEAHDDRAAGPILCTQYTLSGGILKLAAQLMPVGKDDARTAALQVRRGDAWQTVATADVVEPGWVALFRVENWDASADVPCRVLYELKEAGGRTRPCESAGTIRRDPVDKPVIVVAGFTGNHNAAGGVEGASFPWTPEMMWFPHNEVVRHVAAHKPDLLFFSGDQVYEGASPTAPDTQNIMLDYLYKWYLWCWAFADLARGTPCVTTPDDHDVYQGNLWGGGGRAIDKDDKGGYVHPAEFVRMVERTQTSHLPDPYDPAPVEQGIGVYFCRFLWGRISFAVVEDRKFKSGPSGLAPPTTSGRADHVVDPNFDPRTADVPGAEMLGPRQEKFLREWAADWQGTDMKVELSQTLYANAATTHGAGQERLVADLDSCGWPQSGRNRALDALRRGFAFMLNGDQHLATMVHHGIDDWGDAGWSLCVPSVANFYPRAWLPEKPGRNRAEGMPDYTGEFLDGLGNRITVWAATNPTPQGREPARLHDRMPGYGIVRLNKREQTVTIECWPRYADPQDPKTGGQYPGWPKTIAMEDNYGRKAAAYLPTIEVRGMERPVVQVVDEKDGDIVYTLRIKGASFRPKVFREGTYTVRVGEPGTDRMTTLTGLKSLPADQEKKVQVVF